ncbi:Protein sfk1 [Lachnellula suecica]|uniref:Protein sfk1 n=1 Tax=Lachnellula suecica TaxID=602035 RepID=A0A8T9BVL1_9HELO|nr:Protein sfk1 [Lachnellula suecica]
MFGISWRSYWIVPVFSGCVWLGMLLGMFLWWVIDTHKAILPPENTRPGETIPYISDVGAHELQPLFIAGGTTTVVTFTTVFVAERWLRHKNRLAGNTSWLQKILSILSIIAALVGMIGMIILTCQNDLYHDRTHDICLGLFIGGYIVSAIFICWEYQRLGIHYRQHRIIRISFWIKLAFIFIEVGLVIAFGVTAYKDHYTAAAVCEWTVSLIYTLYVWSFALDFWPAFSNSQVVKENGEVEMGQTAEMAAQNDNGRSGYAY